MEEIVFPDNATIKDLLAAAVSNVTTTMLQIPTTFKQRFTEEELGGSNSPFYQLGTKDPLIVGSIGFTGEANGVVYIYLEDRVATRMAEAMTGMEPEEIAEEPEIMKDVIGEISNMIVGGFKNGICDLGFQCRVTLPTVIRGSTMEVDSIQSAERTIFLFDFEGGPLVIDLFIQSA